MKITILTVVLLIVALTLFSCGNNENKKGINGLKPVDVYLNCEDQGFKTDKITNEGGYMWINTKDVDNYSYKIDTYSSTVNSVETVRATAMVSGGDEIINATGFFTFVASLPYEGAEPNKAAEWINENFNNDGATTTIGNVKFTWTAPSAIVRILDIEKN